MPGRVAPETGMGEMKKSLLPPECFSGSVPGGGGGGGGWREGEFDRRWGGNASCKLVEKRIHEPPKLRLFLRTLPARF